MCRIAAVAKIQSMYSLFIRLASASLRLSMPSRVSFKYATAGRGTDRVASHQKTSDSEATPTGPVLSRP